METNQASRSSHSNGRLIFGLVGIGILALFLGVYSWTYQRSQAPAEPIVSYDFGEGETDVVPLEEYQSLGGVTVGAAAPDFTLLDLDGNEVSLSDFVGQPVIVNFWAEWCAPCRSEMPEFQRAFEAHHEEDGLVILAVNQADPENVIREFFYDEMELTFTPLMDDRVEVAVEYGAFRTLPTTVFITPEGIVSRLYRGPLNQAFLDRFLEDILPNSS